MVHNPVAAAPATVDVELKRLSTLRAHVLRITAELESARPHLSDAAAAAVALAATADPGNGPDEGRPQEITLRVAAVKAALADCSEQLFLISQQQEDFAARFTPTLSFSNLCARSAWADAVQPFGVVKQRLRGQIADVSDSLMEVYNEATDVLFLLELWAKAKLLFWFSVVFLAANVLGRCLVVCREWGDVDPTKKGQFIRSACAYLLEPNVGMRRMKSTLLRDTEGGLVWNQQQGYVKGERDAVAVSAHADLISAKAEVRTLLLLIMTQDVPELAIQIVFLLMTTEAGSEGNATVLFWLTVAGTVLHGTRLGMDAWTTWSQLPRLHRVAEGRDKSFEPNATDDDVDSFASRCGREVRYVNLKDAAAITDQGVIALAARCPHIQRLVLSDCSLLTDRAVVAVAKACPSLIDVQLARCKLLSDAAIYALCECVGIQKLWINSCTKISPPAMQRIGESLPALRDFNAYGTGGWTDASIGAIAQGCPMLDTCVIMGCPELTDRAVVQLSEGCPHIRTIVVADSPKVTDVGVCALLRNCSLGRSSGSSMSFSGTAVSDASLRLLAEGRCPELVTIGLSNTDVTADGVIAMLEGCPKLASLGLLDNPKMSRARTTTMVAEDMLVKIREKRPHVKVW